MPDETMDFEEFAFDSGCEKPSHKGLKSASFTSRPKHVLRRESSETALRDHLPWHWLAGETYHVISQGDIDSLTFLRIAIEQHPLDYCMISTWCMAPDDATEIAVWVKRGLIKRIDFYVGEIFQNGYRGAYDIISATAKQCGGRVAAFRNHSKVMLGASGNWKFAIASSANVNTNPRCENTTITIDAGVFQFYKNFYDKITAFNRDFDGWNPA